MYIYLLDLGALEAVKKIGPLTAYTVGKNQRTAFNLSDLQWVAYKS